MGKDDKVIKVKISYEREEELFRVLRLLEPVIVKWKRSKNQDGRFKKAYAELCEPWKLHANPNTFSGNPPCGLSSPSVRISDGCDNGSTGVSTGK